MIKSTAGKRVSRWTWACTGWRVWVFGPALFLLVAILGVGLAVTHRPAWYRPVPADPARLHADKAALVALEDEISAALNAGQPVRIQLREEQVNRWLAARTEMWPGLASDLGGVEDPWVSLADGVLRGAATIRRGTVEGVVALTGRVEVTEDTVVVRWDAAQLGAIPIPQKWVSYALARIPASVRAAVQQDNAGVVTLRNEWVWPNGKRHFRLRDSQVSNGVVDIVLEPLPRGQARTMRPGGGD